MVSRERSGMTHESEHLGGEGIVSVRSRHEASVVMIRKHIEVGRPLFVSRPLMRGVLTSSTER